MKIHNHFWYYFYLVGGVLLFISNYIFPTSDYFNSFSFVLMLSGIGAFIGLLIKNKKRLVYSNKTRKLLLSILLFDVLFFILLFLFFPSIQFVKTAIVIVILFSTIISLIVINRTNLIQK
ncbi:hypothetical protein MNBD_BACTEROID01-2287 [hydrothermal vent metagenome]|uniref:Uncharacterized protein n=1 Tax=hydrothermal vent metagenome TaxID=652676 RepID=A0A3B0TZ95_9ZZZZ